MALESRVRQRNAPFSKSEKMKKEKVRYGAKTRALSALRVIRPTRATRLTG